MSHFPSSPDAKLDLVLERVVDVPRELVWQAWTNPRHLIKWFTPAPWTTVSCEIDLRPGGVFRALMRSPDGQESEHLGCYLEIVEPERLVWTDALRPGFRPSPRPFVTAIIELAARGGGTLYRATVLHADEATRQRHVEMGFAAGWGKALDQLVAHAKAM